jgi:trimethylamine--corrinoid protein Co-methyltransferase
VRLLREIRHGLRGPAAVHRLHAALTTGPDDLAVDAIREVGPGGHFFGIQHTQDRYETAFYSPFLSDWSNYENWEDRGAVTTVERANRVCKQILAEYEPPPMDEAIREELADFVARRKQEGGAPTDF